MLKSLIITLLNRLGYTIYKSHRLSIDEERARNPDMEEGFFQLYQRCKPFTMTSIEKMYALHKATEYIVRNRVPGDMVECGVWKGGSIMMIALTLLDLGEQRTIHLYDTFEGMSEPSDKDTDRAGRPAADYLNAGPKQKNIVWCYAPQEEVIANIYSTGYPADRFRIIKGKVEDTLPAARPESISLLRLDTDWYDSTYHSMRHLYPLLSPRGVFIQDDYGSWSGAKTATDQYFNEHQIVALLHRVDVSSRVLVNI